MKGLNQVFNAGTMGIAIPVAQLADGFGAADLDAVYLMGDYDLLFDLLFTYFVIPDLHFHPPVELPSLLRGIVGHRLAVAKPLVGDGFGREIQRTLAVFGDGACSLP